jgi:hypothetical protein
MANQRKTIFFDLVARTLSKFSLPRNLTSTFGAEYILKYTYTYRQYKHILTHTNSIVCDMYLATSYNKIHTIHTNTGHIHTRKAGLEKNEFVYVKASICMYLSVFELYLQCILYVFCLFCMYLAECVCIDATSNFSCRKYKQIHAIQTHTCKYRHCCMCLYAVFMEKTKKCMKHKFKCLLKVLQGTKLQLKTNSELKHKKKLKNGDKKFV